MKKFMKILSLLVLSLLSFSLTARPEYSTVFANGSDGYEVFRIPSIVSLPDGRILAIAEGRSSHRGDCSENDIVLKYSDDKGRTWSPLILLAESGNASLNNPTSIFIPEKGRIMVLFQEYPFETNEMLTQSGFEGDNITRTYIIYSDDRGLTWSPKRDITKEIKLKEATGYATGPGACLQVIAGKDKGRIIVPINVTGAGNDWFNYLAASDDFGESFFILPGRSAYGTNESQIVQISDNVFLINARSHRFFGNEEKAPADWNPWADDRMPHCRAFIKVTIDGRKTVWHQTVIRKDLPDPICQGSIIRYSGLNNNEESIILMSNAASSDSRSNGTVRVSCNEGETWKYSKRIYGKPDTEFQYSVLARLDDGSIACIFESEGKIKMAVFDLEWLKSK